MPQLYAFALAGSVVAAIASWLILQFPGLLLWAAFIGWGSFSQAGGNSAAFKKSVACTVFGALMAWLVAYPIAAGVVGLSVPLAAGGLVAIATPIIILASKLELLSVVPATFYGFASSFAFLVQTPGKFDPIAMTSTSLDNVLIVVTLSSIVGALLGVVHSRLAGILMSKQEI